MPLTLPDRQLSPLSSAALSTTYTALAEYNFSAFHLIDGSLSTTAATTDTTASAHWVAVQVSPYAVIDQVAAYNRHDFPRERSGRIERAATALYVAGRVI
jgi:hypothetical protein